MRRDDAPIRSADVREVRPLVLVGLVGLLGWAFVAVASAVTDGELHHVDRAIMLALRDPGDASDPLGPGWVEEFGRDLTALGSVGVLTLVTVAVCGLLWLTNKRRAALVVVIAVAGAALLSQGLKHIFQRPRPDLVVHAMRVYTYSFPSGHSMQSAATYLTLAALLGRVYPRRVIRAYLLSVAIIVVGLVGVSRVYLGVHWPSDVLAGWTVGAAWSVLCALMMRRLQRGGAVEPGER